MEHLAKVGQVFEVSIRSFDEMYYYKVVKLHGKKTVTAIELRLKHFDSKTNPRLAGKHIPDTSREISEALDHEILKVRLSESGGGILFAKDGLYGHEYNGIPKHCSCHYMR